jgi:hypothetical protein
VSQAEEEEEEEGEGEEKRHLTLVGARFREASKTRGTAASFGIEHADSTPVIL